MSSRTGHLALLKNLPRAELDRTLEHTLSDTVAQLGVAIEEVARARGHSLHNCVVDSVQLTQTDLGETECRTFIQFNASARRGETGRRDNQHLAGNAEASIDDTGAVNYRAITFTEERGFVPHDEGGEG